jgi:hypothetical protein
VCWALGIRCWAFLFLCLRAAEAASPQDAPPRFAPAASSCFLWGSAGRGQCGQDIGGVWRPTDLVSGYKVYTRRAGVPKCFVWHCVVRGTWNSQQTANGPIRATIAPPICLRGALGGCLGVYVARMIPIGPGGMQMQSGFSTLRYVRRGFRKKKSGPRSPGANPGSPRANPPPGPPRRLAAKNGKGELCTALTTSC